MMLNIPTAATMANIRFFDHTFSLAPLLARRNETGEMVFWLVIFAVSICAICAVIYAATHILNQWRYNNHSSLFYALCNEHNLDKNARAMLKQVVRHHGMREPARVFTEPQWLDPAKLGKPFAARAEELLVLRKNLFAITKNS